METFIFDKISELRKNKPELEKKLNVVIKITGKKVTVEGEAIDEYESSKVIDAINLGFSAKKALLLKDPDMSFRYFNIKKFTRRKQLNDVRARVIGTEGKTKRALENVGSCSIVIKGNEMGVIAPAETIEETTTAIKSLIRGSKQANVYAFLEKMNRERKKFPEDLGLKEEKKEGTEEE